MSNRQFWNFLDLGQIANSTFAKLFYKAVCDFNDNTKLDHLKFMDRYKFYQFIAIFTKTNELNQNKNLFFEDNDKLSEFDDEDKLNSFASYVKLKFLNSLFDIELIREKYENYI